MTRKFTALLLAAACGALCLTGCGNSEGGSENETPAERKAKYDSDLLCGIHFTFYDDIENPIEELNKPLESGEAVAAYTVMEYHEDLNGYFEIKGYDGDGVFLTVENRIGSIRTDNGNTHEITLEKTLYITNEYEGKYVCYEWLYYNDDTKEFSHSGKTFTNLYFSLTGTQALTADGVDKDGKAYTVNYNASVKINIERIDRLTNVKISEYSANNEIIKTTEFINDGQHNDYRPSENCEYIIVEEEYADSDGEKYRERTLINKDNNNSLILKFPYKMGLVKPTELKIKW